MSAENQGHGGHRRAKKFSTSRVQKRAHPILLDAGYAWVRTDRNEHNIYRNTSGQAIDVASSPRNESAYLKLLQSRIKTHDRERQAMNATSKVSPVDEYVAMADSFLMKDPGRARHAILARIAALDTWMRRVLERHGPVLGADLTEATNRMGISPTTSNAARQRIGAGNYQSQNRWYVCLPEQAPEGANVRYPDRLKRENRDVAVDPVAPDPIVIPDNVTSPLQPEPVSSNGKQPLTDQQAAFLMMAESLGIKLPGDQAKEALADARSALEHAMHQVEQAMDALA